MTPQPFVAARRCLILTTKFLFELRLEAHVFHKTLIAFAAAAALGCLPMATTALAAHSHAGRADICGFAYRWRPYCPIWHGAPMSPLGGGYVNGPIYDSCAGYGMAMAMVTVPVMARWMPWLWRCLSSAALLMAFWGGYSIENSWLRDKPGNAFPLDLVRGLLPALRLISPAKTARIREMNSKP